MAAVRTTVIGSFPKPEYLAVPDWFQDPTVSAATKAYTKLMRDQNEEQREQLEASFVRATKEAIDVQAACGIGVVTDGEVRRENYIHYLCRFVDGIDFENLTETSIRNGAMKTELPTVRGKLSWRGPLDVAAEWRAAQDLAGSTPLKYTLPGPMTIIGTIHDAHYGDEEALAADLATIVNMHIRALAAAGCRHIQVDEPLFARQPKKALRWGIKMMERCFDSITGDTCERIMHICCGYPRHLDDPDYLKADPAAYFEIAEAVDASCVDAVSIEDAHCHNDLKLLESFKRTKVILGVVQIASSRVETQEEIEARIREALQHIDSERLIVAPDCGLAHLPPTILKQKLTNMCAAAKSCGGDGLACKRARLE